MIAIILSGVIFCIKIWLLHIGINFLKKVINYANTEYPEQNV